MKTPAILKRLITPLFCLVQVVVLIAYQVPVKSFAATIEPQKTPITTEDLNDILAGHTYFSVKEMAEGFEFPGKAKCGTPSNTGGSIPGTSNKEKVYYYFINKGLSPVQASGIMGSLQAEAHFEPRLVEYGFLNSRDEVSKAGQPSSLDDNVPPNRNKDGTPSTNGVPGYGIAQFTSPSYKQQLRDAATSRGVIAGDLLLQLDTLWNMLNSPNLIKAVLNPIRESNNLKIVTDLFTNGYEKPGGDRPTALAKRLNLATAILAELGSKNAPSSSGTPGVDSVCSGGTAGQILISVSGKVPCPIGLSQSSNVEAYDNGKLEIINTCSTHGVWVNATIAKNIDNLFNDALAAGLNLSNPGGGFRTMAAQKSQWAIRCPGVPETTKYSRPPCLATSATMARPGYSNHGMGLAIDFTCNGSSIGVTYAGAKTNPCWLWLSAHAAEYGMYEWGYDAATGIGNRTSTYYEAWHWSVNGN